MRDFQPETRENAESVSLIDVVTASIEIYGEWETAESDAIRDESERALSDEERIAYQEGLLRALELLNARTGITIETMAPEARDRLGIDVDTDGPGDADAGRAFADADADADADEYADGPGKCDRCGRDRIYEMGNPDPLCPHCEG